MLELKFADHADLKKQGRSFDCSTCPSRVQQIRRCKESREDFTSQDGAIWPIQINKGSSGYSFCPGKATWDHRLLDLFNELCLICEFKIFPKPGCLNDQDDSLIQTLFWFYPSYENMKFVQKASMILGDGKAKNNSEINGLNKANGSKRK